MDSHTIMKVKAIFLIQEWEILGEMHCWFVKKQPAGTKLIKKVWCVQ